MCSDIRPVLTPSLQFPSLALLTATLVNSTWHKQSRGLRRRDERFIVCLRAALSSCSNTSPGSHICLAVTYCTSLKQENSVISDQNMEENLKCLKNENALVFTFWRFERACNFGCLGKATLSIIHCRFNTNLKNWWSNIQSVRNRVGGGHQTCPVSTSSLSNVFKSSAEVGCQIALALQQPVMSRERGWELGSALPGSASSWIHLTA